MTEAHGALPTFSIRAPVEHQAILREAARALRERPGFETILRGALAGEVIGTVALTPASVADAVLAAQNAAAEADLPKPGEFPKWVNGRLVNNRREERESLALGPAEVKEAPLSDYDKVALGFEQNLRDQEAARQQHEMARARFML